MKRKFSLLASVLIVIVLLTAVSGSVLAEQADASPAPETTETPAPAGPRITKHPGGETISAMGSAIFVARAEGASEITWYLVAPRGVSYDISQTEQVFTGMKVVGQGTEAIALYNIPAEFTGWQVECHFKNPQGAESISDRATITVSTTMPAAPTITRAPSSAYLMFGEKVTLSVYADAPAGNSIKYQWFSTEQNNPATATAIPDATTPEFTPPEKDGTMYYCVGIRSVNNESVSTVAYTELVPVTYSNEPEVPAHVHSFDETWKNDDVYHWHECAECGEIADKATHSYNWTETVKPTSRKQGERVGVCSVCGYRTTQTVPAQSSQSGKPGKGILIALLILVILLMLLGAYRYLFGGLPLDLFRGKGKGSGGRHSGNRNSRE